MASTPTQKDDSTSAKDAATEKTPPSNEGSQDIRDSLSPSEDGEQPVSLFKPLSIQTTNIATSTGEHSLTNAGETPHGYFRSPGFYGSPSSNDSKATGGLTATNQSLRGDEHFIGTSEGHHLHPFEYAALQLMEESCAKKDEIALILPELQVALSDTAKASVKESAIQKVKQWAAKQKTEQERTKTRRKTQLSGWLRKVGTSKLTSARRWVVLDGQTLMYFKDDTETELKGVLQVSGCHCYYSKSIADPRKYVFTVTSGDGQHEYNEFFESDEYGSDGHRSSDIVLPDSRAEEEKSTISSVDDDVLMNIASVPILNPLHESKLKYRWAANSEEERKRWVDYINIASRIPPIEDEFLLWAKQLSSASNGIAYRRILRQLTNRITLATTLLRRSVARETAFWHFVGASVAAEQRIKFMNTGGWICVSADWVRTMRQVSASAATETSRQQQKKKRSLFPGKRRNDKSSLKSKTLPKSGLPSRAERPPVAPSASGNGESSPVQPTERSFSTTSSTQSPPRSPYLPSPVVGQRRYINRNELNGNSVSRVFQPNSSIDTEAFGGATNWSTTKHTGLSKLAEQAVAVASASRYKRRMGFTPGDRVNMRQLDRDLIRDVVELNVYIVSPSSKELGTTSKSDTMTLSYFGEVSSEEGRSIVPVLHDRYEQCDSNWLLKVVADRILHTMRAVGKWEDFASKWGTFPPQRQVSDTLDAFQDDRDPDEELFDNVFQALNALVSGGDSSVQVEQGKSNEKKYTRRRNWPNLQQSHVEARCLEFAREILLCSSRTATGGDAYDAVDLLFKNRELAVLSPDSAAAPPITLDIEIEAPVVELEAISSGDVEQPLTSKSKAGLQKELSSDVICSWEKAHSSDSNARETSFHQEETLQELRSKWRVRVVESASVSVRVDSGMYYRIRSADPEDEPTEEEMEEGKISGSFGSPLKETRAIQTQENLSEHSSAEPDAHSREAKSGAEHFDGSVTPYDRDSTPSGTKWQIGDWGYITAIFRRRLPWGEAPYPAYIALGTTLREVKTRVCPEDDSSEHPLVEK